MYVPPALAESRAGVLTQFIRRHGFGTLVTSDPQAGLCASHLPFLFAEDGEGRGTLTSHMARQNDQWRALTPGAEVLVIFQGPHTYVSPRWYQTKLAVPTWNYTAAHAYGRPRLIEDPAAVRRVLSDTVAAYEGTGDGAWSDGDLPPDFAQKMASAVVAFAVEVARIEGKFKLSQNRPAGDRRGVVAALEAVGGDDARAVAELMRAGLGDGSA